MRLTIADEALTSLEPHVTPARSMEALVELALSRIAHVGPQSRYVVLGEAEVNQMETRLGCPPISDAKALYQAVDRLAEIELSKISFEFTPAQLSELKHHAEREQQTVEEYAKRIVQAMIPLFFQTAPAQTAPAVKKK
jgi:hypothetical protein